jgi:N-acyl-D-aspartate/D-glutamate deacylase
MQLEPLQELNLDVSTEELLSAETAFTYADLHAILKSDDTVVWLTPHAAVVRKHRLAMFATSRLNVRCRFYFNVDGKDIVAFAHSLEHLYEIFDVVLRLLAVSVVQSIHLCDKAPNLVINALTLEYLMEQCQSLKVLSLSSLYMNENHIRVLGDHSRPDLEIELRFCKLYECRSKCFGRGPWTQSRPDQTIFL